MNRRELAQAMREGIRRIEVTENRWNFIVYKRASWQVCALGAALVTKYGDCYTARIAFEKRKAWSFRMPWTILAEMLDISKSLAREVSKRHAGGQSVDQIAQWLDFDPLGEGWE